MRICWDPPSCEQPTPLPRLNPLVPSQPFPFCSPKGFQNRSSLPVGQTCWWGEGGWQAER